jgi:hypothetical protein
VGGETGDFVGLRSGSDRSPHAPTTAIAAIAATAETAEIARGHAYCSNESPLPVGSAKSPNDTHANERFRFG